MGGLLKILTIRPFNSNIYILISQRLLTLGMFLTPAATKNWQKETGETAAFCTNNAILEHKQFEKE